tara:strand:- start:115 stop:792 length:678 start_codon:yes stop_codon:yes gene_type:complete
MDKIILEAKDIFKSFSNGENKLNVLKNFSIKIFEGEIITIMGESGCGKSTALNILGTLDSPDKGVIEIDSILINNLGDKEISELRNEKIGFVFQSYHLLPEFTALENVLMPVWIGRKKNIKNLVLEIFDDLGIIDRVDHYPNQLSGGEKARVAVIRAIINKPKILFADEPTGNLDKINAKKLIDLFEKLNKDYNQAIILTTHNNSIANFGQRILKLENGKLHLKS